VVWDLPRQSAAVAVDVDLVQVFQEQRVAVAVVLAALSVKPEVQVHPVRDLRVEALARTRFLIEVLVVVALVLLVLMETRQAAQVALEIRISQRFMLAAAVVETHQTVNRLAAVVAAVQVVMQFLLQAQPEQQTQAAVVAVQVRLLLQETQQAESAAAALLLCATAERQLDQLQEQQIPLHKQVATPSTPS